MAPAEDAAPSILIVDDEQSVADLYSTWLQDTYTVQAAYSGQDALEQFDHTIDVVLLDRRMPRLSGDEVLETIRDDGYDCQVVMVTAVDPDFDVLKLGFDGYVTKPITKHDLHEIIDQLEPRRSYDDKLQTYYRLVAQRAALTAEKTADELASSQRFTSLEERIAALETELDTTLDAFQHDDFEATLRRLNQA